MFTDEVELTISGGRGGDGKVAFFPFKKGPCGGDGGRGGDVYIYSDANHQLLNKYAGKASFKAEDGGAGQKNRKKGAQGKDLHLPMPIGTIITDINSKEQIELTKPGQSFLICAGGEGGRGNDYFKSSTNQVPRQSTNGAPGESRTIKIVMRLSADYGLIGLPNAGKSSILNMLTAAHVKTADYPFTTLEPYLGAFGTKIIADIPGLIEGASKGRGLGVTFLKHIEKVQVLLHCISAESTDLKKDYKLILNELAEYNPELVKKNMVVLLTKSDLITVSQRKAKIRLLKKLNPQVLPISIYDSKSIDALKKILSPKY